MNYSSLTSKFRSQKKKKTKPKKGVKKREEGISEEHRGDKVESEYLGSSMSSVISQGSVSPVIILFYIKIVDERVHFHCN